MRLQWRSFATVSRIPQTLVEKVVQKYAVGLPEGRIVKSGDYVMIQPEHVMTHDNTGPVISKLAATLCREFLPYPSSSGSIRLV